MINGDGETGKTLVEHPVPGLVSITGSIRAGISVAVSAAQQLKRAHLELGGKAPVVVFADADIEAAASGIAEAGYFNAGQDCTAATRVIVAEKIHDQFVEALVAQAKQTRPGDRDDEDAAYGPLNNANHFAKVCAIMAKLPDHATVATGGKQFGTEGFFFEPTVITGLQQEDQAIQEEIFGPVITVQPFQDEADALAKANGVPYGLSSSVWTKDHATALRMSRDLDFGCVWINTHIPLAAEMPHGGFGQSGLRQGLVRVRIGGLHPGQARDELARMMVPAQPRSSTAPATLVINRYVDILASDGVDRGLIGPRELGRLWERHILNSAALAQLIHSGSSVVDVGSGAGLPGIPIAVLRPDLKVTLLEPLLRRSTFLTQIVDDLGLRSRVRVVRARAEDHGDRYGVVVARAVAPLEKLVGWTNPLRTPGGTILALKGQGAGGEVDTARDSA